MTPPSLGRSRSLALGMALTTAVLFWAPARSAPASYQVFLDVEGALHGAEDGARLREIAAVPAAACRTIDCDALVTNGVRVESDAGGWHVSPLSDALLLGQGIDVNSASVASLDSLPSIGPARAQAIVAARARRPFRNLDDLTQRVKGLGPVRGEQLAPYLRFEGQEPLEVDMTAVAAPESDLSYRLDINSASAEALNALPGIGPVKAEAIVWERRRRGPYRTVDSLARVPGIGPVTVERLRASVDVVQD